MEKLEFNLEVKRTNRKKTASICLMGNLVKVSVPKSLSDKQIQGLIDQRISWIRAKLKEQALRPAMKPKEYMSGETVAYLGESYILKVIDGDKAFIKMIGKHLIATVSEYEINKQETVKYLLEGWYSRQAERHLVEKTKHFAEIIGVAPKSVAVKNYKARWGSCSIHGKITYNWRIILAPHHIIDYVVIHELCHLLEHNHSPRFWRHVEKYVPNSKECRKWLRHFIV